MPPHRSQFEMIVDLLDALDRHPNYAKTRIAGIAGINYNKPMKHFMEMLNHNGLIQFVDGKAAGNRQCSHVVRLTHHGKDWLQRATRLLDEIHMEDRI